MPRQTEIKVEVPDIGRVRTNVTVTALRRIWRCQLAYWFAYVAGRGQPVSAGEWSLGAVVHGTLKRLFDLPPNQRTSDALFELVLAEWRVDHPNEYFDYLYLARSKAAGILRLVDVERIDVVGTEVPVTGAFGRFRVTGRIDLLYRDPEGNNVVADYKTRLRSPKSPLQDPMLTMLSYELLLSDRYSDRDIETVLELLGLDPPVAERQGPITATQRAQHRDEVMRHLDLVGVADKSNVWTGRVRPSCEGCTFYKDCPAVAQARRSNSAPSFVTMSLPDVPPRRTDG